MESVTLVVTQAATIEDRLHAQAQAMTAPPGLTDRTGSGHPGLYVAEVQGFRVLVVGLGPHGRDCAVLAWHSGRCDPRPAHSSLLRRARQQRHPAFHYGRSGQSAVVDLARYPALIRGEVRVADDGDQRAVIADGAVLVADGAETDRLD